MAVTDTSRAAIISSKPMVSGSVGAPKSNSVIRQQSSMVTEWGGIFIKSSSRVLATLGSAYLRSRQHYGDDALADFQRFTRIVVNADLGGVLAGTHGRAATALFLIAANELDRIAYSLRLTRGHSDLHLLRHRYHAVYHHIQCTTKNLNCVSAWDTAELHFELKYVFRIAAQWTIAAAGVMDMIKGATVVDETSLTLLTLNTEPSLG